MSKYSSRWHVCMYRCLTSCLHCRVMAGAGAQRLLSLLPDLRRLRTLQDQGAPPYQGTSALAQDCHASRLPNRACDLVHRRASSLI